MFERDYKYCNIRYDEWTSIVECSRKRLEVTIVDFRISQRFAAETSLEEI